MKQIVIYFSVLSIAAALARGQGFVLWDESVNGSLGNSTGNATSLTPLTLGMNLVIGSTEIEPTGSSWFVHEDYFTFSVPTNSRVSSISLSIDSSRTWSWIGSAAFNTQLGFLPNSSTGSLLSQWNIQPLEAGQYGMYMANNNNQPVTTVANYRLEFFLSPVPEPSTWALLGLGSVLFWFAAHRRQR